MAPKAPYFASEANWKFAENERRFCPFLSQRQVSHWLRGLVARFISILLAIIVATAFASNKKIMLISGRKFFLEVARTPAERARGLMFRKSLPENQAMLFCFPEEKIEYFWMKNTPLPLDIAFFDSNGTVVSEKAMVPFRETPVSSEKPCRFALEGNRGLFQRIHLRIRDTVPEIATSCGKS